VAEDMWAFDEIVVDVAGFFTTQHTFRSASRTLAVLTVPAGMAEGSYEGRSGQHVVVRRTGCLSRGYELCDGDIVRGAAEPRGLFKMGYAVQFDGQGLELVPEGVFRQGWLLLDAGGRVLLRLEPLGVFKRGTRLMAPQPIEFPLAVLAYYLYQVQQQETAAVATTAAAA
jgi:hypothetical protein